MVGLGLKMLRVKAALINQLAISALQMQIRQIKCKISLLDGTSETASIFTHNDSSKVLTLHLSMKTRPKATLLDAIDRVIYLA